MPTLTLSIPHSAWAKLEKVAEREGVNVRTLCIYRIRDAIAEYEALDPQPVDQAPAEAAA